MRIVLDTHVVISDFLWQGAPRRLLDAAIDVRIALFTCAALIAELAEVCTSSCE